MRKILLFFCFLCPCFYSCQNKTTHPRKQQLNLNIPSDPATLDPRKGGDLVSSLMHFLTFEGLTRMDDEGNIVPALASRIEISDDRKTYTFHLREAFWSNKTPITAWDFEKSWKDILHPDFPAMNAHLLYPIKNAEKAKHGLASPSEIGINSLSAKTLQVTLENPTPYFLDLVGFCVFFPANSEIDHTNPDWATQEDFVCSGPFILSKWKRNNTIVLTKNPHYFRADSVSLEKIKFNMVSSEMTALQMYEKGEIDILGQPLMPLPTDAIPQIAEKEKIELTRSPGTTFCTFNVDTFPLNNVHIRKALAYAIDREQIVRNITQLHEELALGMIPPVLKKKGGKHAFFRDADYVLAREHLAKGLEELNLKHEHFPRLKFLYSNSEEHHKIAQALQQQWQEHLGITIDLESVDKKILLHRLKARSYQIAQSFWMAQYNDSFNILERFKSRDNAKNYPNWENKTYSQLLSQSCEAATDEERIQLLEQAEEIFLDEMPLAPIFHWNSAYIKKPYVKSYGIAPIGNGFFERVYIDTDIKDAQKP